MLLSDLGVATFNRAGSPKCIHDIFRRILEEEGFTMFWYKNAIVLEPKPNDPLAVARRTNDEVQSQMVCSRQFQTNLCLASPH